MFPPKHTNSVTEWLEFLLASLARAGLEFDQNIILDELPNGEAEVKLRLTGPIAKEGWEHLKDYATSYSLVCGWRLKNLRYSVRWITFRASRA